MCISKASGRTISRLNAASSFGLDFLGIVVFPFKYRAKFSKYGRIAVFLPFHLQFSTFFILHPISFEEANALVLKEINTNRN
jgi:hypothetical protein